MSPRETRVHAPGKPSSRQETEWYFQRFVPFLPAAEDFVVFNRSWYNRAGVEKVMHFCTKEEVEEFFESVVPFEAMLVRDGIAIRKYYLDISRDEQRERLKAREKDPLTQWKVSPVDEKAMQNWKAYSKARDEMFSRSSHAVAPWRILLSDNKKVRPPRTYPRSAGKLRLQRQIEEAAQPRHRHRLPMERSRSGAGGEVIGSRGPRPLTRAGAVSLHVSASLSHKGRGEARMLHQRRKISARNPLSPCGEGSSAAPSNRPGAGEE